MTMDADAEIRQEVVRRLAWDPEVEGAEIGVSVRDGVVTLAGAVRAYQKAAAARVAASAPGVRAVRDDLIVRSATILTDEEIVARIPALLEADPAIPRERIGVRVAGGVVELTGEVDRASERRAAEDIVSEIPGVAEVRNRIAVTGPPATPAEIVAAIEAALVRESRADAARVSARVEGTRAILFGAVRSAAERDAAEQAALRARGISEVANEIRVEPW